MMEPAEPVKNLISLLAERISERKVILCTPHTNLYTNLSSDKSWGCGYRNLQILLSSLSFSVPISIDVPSEPPGFIPSIACIQKNIDYAWREGWDAEGALQFNGRIIGSRKWIGATEIVMLLYRWRIPCKLVDFKGATGIGNQHRHQKLLNLVKEYFVSSVDNNLIQGNSVVQTSLPPIYLQHQGHSRSIVGIEINNDEVVAFYMFDPSLDQKGVTKAVYSRDLERLFRLPVSMLHHSQYQLVIVVTKQSLNSLTPKFDFESPEQTHYRKRGAYAYEKYP